MAMLPSAFNTEEAQGMDDRTDFPKGTQIVMAIEKSDYKPNSKKTGHYLALYAKVQEGEFKNRVAFINLNLDNPNAVAVEIANKELKTICDAVGFVGALRDTTDIHGIPFIGVADGKGGFTNYKSLDGVAKPSAAKPSSPKPAGPKPKVTFG